MIRDFNICDPRITHVGIGLWTDGRFSVIHVSNENNKSATALMTQSIGEFVIDTSVHYLGVYEIKVRGDILVKLVDEIAAFKHRKIYFDDAFKISNGDYLYCSEFCATLLNDCGAIPVCFPITRDLNSPFMEAVLERKKLTYYPVDFLKRYRMLRVLKNIFLKSDKLIAKMVTGNSYHFMDELFKF